MNIAVVGIHGQGGHVRWCDLKDNRNVRLKTICDVDEQFFADKVAIILEKAE